MIKLGIFGSYSTGNFGDVLMALLYANKAKSLSNVSDVVVFGIDEELAEKHSVFTVKDVSKFVESVDAIIIGGGAILSLPAIVSGYRKKLVSQLNELIRFVENRGIPLAFFSIGSAGEGVANSTVWQLVKLSSRHSTVRLRGDLEDLAPIRRFGYAPDVVLCANQSNYKLIKKEAVGFNLTPKQGFFLGPVILLMGALFRRKIIFFETHSSPTFQTDYMPPRWLIELFSNVSFHVCKDPFEVVRTLRTVDCLVSYKLHLGVAAMSVGCKVIFDQRNKKVMEFILEDWCSAGVYQTPVGILKAFFPSGLSASGCRSAQKGEESLHFCRLKSFISSID